MKKILLFGASLAIAACSTFDKHEADDVSTASYIQIDAPEGGAIYLNGQFTGQYSPNRLKSDNGEITVSVGFENQKQYWRKTVEINGDTTVKLTDADAVQPKIWKALFVGVSRAQARNREQQVCHTDFSPSELDTAYEFFQMNMRDHIETFSFGTVKWQTERVDITAPVDLNYNENNDWYTLEPEQGLSQLVQLTDFQPGDYDTIFYFWREQQNQCDFTSGYFGLAWLEPWEENTKQTGYVTVKFNPKEIGVKRMHDWYRDNDPGVWTHEWLHVVIEKFYPKLGVNVPIPPEDVLILHAAQAYGYGYPWMDWYRDLISGRVKMGEQYTGIGPEALLSCSIRDLALKKCEFK